MREVLKTYPFTVIVTVGVVALSVFPIPEVEPLEEVPLIDKWVHFVMYGGLALAAWLDSRRRVCKKQGGRSAQGRLGWGVWIFAVAYPAALGGLLELVQAYLTTYRSGDWLDFVADCVGVALAFPLGLAYYLRKRG